jgi:integrase
MTKRGYGSGSLRELRPGVWELRYQGRSRRVKGGRKEAERALAQIVSAGAGRGPAVLGVTLSKLVSEWLAAAQIEDSTRATYLTALKHLPPKLGATRLDRLTLRDFDQLYADLDRAGLGRHQIRKLHTALSAALTEAVRWGYVDHHPARGARLPALPDSPATVPPAEALDRLRAGAAHDPLVWVWLRLALATGARRGEVLALRWSSFDLRAATMTVARSLNEDRSTKVTKSNRVRAVELDGTTVDVLRRWRLEQRRIALAAGVPMARDPFVLSSAIDGSIPWRPDGATQRFRRLCAKVGVTGVRLHDLRHANASLMLNAGVDLPTAAYRLGHARPDTTLRVYAHVIKGANQAAASKLEQQLG